MGSSDGQAPLSTYFNYDSLDHNHRLIIQQHTGEIRKRLRRSAQDIWEIGQRLADVRSRLKYGQFLGWLKAEFGWSQRTAYNFINVYEAFGDKFENLANVDIATSILYQLAAPSVPEKLRSQLLASAMEGEKITHKGFKSAIKQHKQVPETQSPPSAKPEIISIIPKEAKPAEVALDALPTPLASINPGWYRLEDKHKIFCGDTASKGFIESAPQAKLAVAVTHQDWAHDWLVDQADSVVILPVEDCTVKLFEQLLTLLSSSGDKVIFPWLPLPKMIAIAHNLGREVYAGDPSSDRCKMAISSLNLVPERIADSLPVTAMK